MFYKIYIKEYKSLKIKQIKNIQKKKKQFGKNMNPNEENCIFCKIAKKEIPSEIINEDELFMTFVDIKPINKGHLLVIPKKHSRNISEMIDPELSKYLAFVKESAEQMKTSLGCDGYNIGMNNEPAAGQIIFHSHFHIIPRYKDDGLTSWPDKE